MSVLTRRFLITFCVLGALALGAMLTSSPPPAAAAGTVIAKKTIKASSGGVLRARNGVQITVPPQVMKRNGTVRITALGRGRYDIHIDAPWSGVVGITVPISGKGDRIIHQVGGLWMPEGSLGQQTVWVSQLSNFWSMKAAQLAKKAKEALCLKSLLPRKITLCLIENGISQIDQELALWLASKVSASCTAAMIASIPYGGVSIAITKMFDDACIGHAGDPVSPVVDPNAGGPVTQTPVPIQGSSPPLQGGTTPPIQGGSPPPAYEPTFGVVNTNTPPPDGVYFRNSPSWGDTARITGLGIFAGEQVKVRCYAWGEAVGPYANRVWYYALNLSRPSIGGRSDEGWMPARFVDDGQVANVVAPGVRAC